jgi:hypothetical protein
MIFVLCFTISALSTRYRLTYLPQFLRVGEREWSLLIYPFVTDIIALLLLVYMLFDELREIVKAVK